MMTVIGAPFIKVWLLTLLFGVVGFPVIFSFCRNLPDRGYSISKFSFLIIMDKYNVKYVIVGSMENNVYPETGLQKFGTFMDIVYQSNGVIIYKRRE